MTPKEALSIVKFSLKNGVKENDHWVCIIEALEKAEKYAWHDLRKNPEDLPEKEKPLLAFVEEQNTYYCAEYDLQDFISDEQYAFFEMGTGIELFYQPIAWRYIEPFEGVKE